MELHYATIDHVRGVPDSIPELPLSPRQIRRRMEIARRRVSSDAPVSEYRKVLAAQQALNDVLLYGVFVYMAEVENVDIPALRPRWNRFDIAARGEWDKGLFTVVQYREDERAPSVKVGSWRIAKRDILNHLINR